MFYDGYYVFQHPLNKPLALLFLNNINRESSHLIVMNKHLPSPYKTYKGIGIVSDWEFLSPRPIKEENFDILIIF